MCTTDAGDEDDNHETTSREPCWELRVISAMTVHADVARHRPLAMLEAYKLGPWPYWNHDTDDEEKGDEKLG